MENLKTLKSNLTTNGFVQIARDPKLKRQIDLVMEAWKAFYEQDIEHKNQYLMTHAGGYELKNKTGETYDNKENMHISIDYDPKVKNMSLRDQVLFNRARRLIRVLFDSIMNVARVFDGYGDSNVVELFEQAKYNFILRLLHYPSGSPDEVLASSHVDKGITVHVTENAPGLQILWKGQWLSIEPEPDHLLAYAGMLGQYYACCAVPALDHRVINCEQTFKNGRDSAVIFIDIGDVTYDKDKWGRTQDVFPNGENYNLNFNAFKKYFTSIENVAL